jgi:hypothetical protein
LLGQKVEMLAPERFRAKHPEYRAGFFRESAGASDGGESRTVRIAQGWRRGPS